MKRTSHYIAFGMTVIVLAGCSIFGSKDKELPPAELLDFEQTLDLKKVWSAKLGKGSELMRLSLAPADLVWASFYAYGAPLAGLLLAAGLVFLLVDPLSDLLAVLVSIAGLLGGGVAGRTLANRNACVSRISPSIEGLANIEKSGLAR